MRVDGGERFGQVVDLPGIHIAGNHQCAGNQGRGHGSLPGLLSGPFEIGQGSLVGDAGQGFMQVFIPGLEIKLDATAGFKRQIHDLVQQPGSHGAVGLPADSQNAALGLLPASCAARMEKGSCGVESPPK